MGDRKLGVSPSVVIEGQSSKVSSLRLDEESSGMQTVDSILEAKLGRRRHDQNGYVRTRLIEELRHSTERPVTLIAAPAGYGKTTVVSQWLASASRPLPSRGYRWTLPTTTRFDVDAYRNGMTARAA